MVQDDWNEALTKPSSMISTAALMLGSWIVLLSIVNMFGGGAGQAGDKVAWIGFFGFGGDAFVPYGDGFLLDDAIFVILGIALVGMGLRNSDVKNWALNFSKSDFMNNLIRGNNSKEIFSSWLVLIGVLFYIVWSIQYGGWVDPGVYSVMISMVAFGVALGINSKVEN